MSQENIGANNKKSKVRMIICIVAFLVLAAMLFLYLNKVFSMGDSDHNRQTFKAFYSETKDTIDVAYLGTSAANRFYINPKAYHDSGISSFTMATMGMPLFFVPTLIDEIEKTQNPELYIIELRWTLKERDMLTDAHIRRVTDNLKYSDNKVKAIDEAFAFMDGSTGGLDDITDKKIEYLVPIIKYHGRLAQGEMAKGDWKLTSKKNKTKGYILSTSTTTQVNQFPSRLAKGKKPMSKEAEQALEQVLDYCDTRDDKQFLFVLSPYSVKKPEMPVFRTAIEMVEDRGYPVINFNTEEMYQELDIDWDKDFYNSKHLNFIGAEKYTAWLTHYLKGHYKLEDHRGDPKYDSWEKAYEKYENYVSDGITVIGHKDKIGGEVTIIYDKKWENENDE